MKTLDALPVLAELTASQWGMVTTAQAAAVDISRMQLSRLVTRGLLERMAHGVYRDAGSASGPWDEIRAAWISSEPARTVEERLRDGVTGVVVGGSTAAHLHGYGDLQPAPYELVSAKRRQSQRADVRYRQRQLSPVDVTVVAGLPTTTIERTVADLVVDHQDLSLVAEVLAGAVRADAIDLDRLAGLLDPIADPSGQSPVEGVPLLQRLLELGGVDAASQLDRVLDGTLRFHSDALKTFQKQIGDEILKSLKVSRPDLRGVLPDVSGIVAAAIGESSLSSAFRESVMRSVMPSAHYITDALLQSGSYVGALQPSGEKRSPQITQNSDA
jgi:hypothetical protein